MLGEHGEEADVDDARTGAFGETIALLQLCNSDRLLRGNLCSERLLKLLSGVQLKFEDFGASGGFLFAAEVEVVDEFEERVGNGAENDGDGAAQRSLPCRGRAGLALLSAGG